MQARYYHPVIGRFLSNDPVGFASGGPAYFNRYAYTANDPVNAIDPGGEETVRIYMEVVGSRRVNKSSLGAPTQAKYQMGIAAGTTSDGGYEVKGFHSKTGTNGDGDGI